MKVEREMKVEVLKDTTDADALKYARKRMDRIVQSASETELWGYSAVDATRNERPGIPCDPHYGPEDN